MRNKITITGDLGSGKSTVAKMIADELACRYFSTGELQRSIAEKENLSTLELNHKSDNKAYIDKLIDSTTEELGLKEDETIFDSRMAWHFVKESLKVRIVVSSDTGAHRIMNAGRADECYQSLEEALDKINARKMSEKNRFKKKYGVDLTDFSHYDLVIDSSERTAKEVMNIILDSYLLWQNEGSFKKIWQ